MSTAEKLRALKEKAAVIFMQYNWFRYAALAFAIGGVLGSITLVILEVLNTNQASFYRGGMFQLHGILSLVAISAAADREPFDVKLGLLFGVLSLIANVYAAIWETTRVVACTNLAPTTVVDNAICFGESMWFANLIFAWFFVVGSLFLLLILYFWLDKINEAAETERCAVLLKGKEEAAIAGKQFAPGMIVGANTHMKLFKRQNETDIVMGRHWLATAQKALAVVGAIVIVAYTAINMIWITSASFYRMPMLIIAAHATGASFGVFGHVPTYWPWIITLFALLGAGTAFWCMIIEWSRPCPGTTAYEVEICANEGWLRWVGPSTATFVTLLMLLTLVFGVWSVVTGRRAVKASKQ